MNRNNVIETIESFLERFVLPEGRDAARKMLDEMLNDAHFEGYSEGCDAAEGRY